MMRSEFDRLQQRLPMEIMSMKRYELPPPPAGKLTDMSAWNECLENSMAQLEHQATRYTAKLFHNPFTDNGCFLTSTTF